MNLFALFSIAALDKFSFNGIRSLLVIYLVTHLHILAADSYKSYAAIMALAYILPLICGYIADKFNYTSKILIFSGLWTCIGMFALLFPWSKGFYLAMATLVIGSGFIKTIIPSLLGKYAKLNNKTEDALFAKLYIYFNVGSFFGTICCSIVGEVIGWNYGFMIAGAAMLLVSILSCGLSTHPGKCESLHSRSSSTEPFFLSIKINFVILFLIFSAIFLLHYQNTLSPMLYFAFALALPILFCRVMNDSKSDAKNVLYLTYLMMIHTVFFALYEQGSLSLVVFTNKMVDRSIVDFLPFLFHFKSVSKTFQMPVTFFQTIDPILNIVLGGFFVTVWEWVAAKKPGLSFVAKFCIGLLVIASAFIVLATFSGAGSLVSPWLLIVTYLLFVLGEQCVVPIGFSAVNTLSPKQFLAFSMGVWFVAIAISETLAGYISVLVSLTSVHDGITVYQKNFYNLGIIITAIAFCFYIFYRIITTIYGKKFNLQTSTMLSDV